MKVLELLELPPGCTLADGAPARPYVRTPLRGLFTIGRSGCTLNVPDAFEVVWCEVNAEGGVRCGDGATARAGSGGLVVLMHGQQRLVLRVVDEAVGSCGWPSEPTWDTWVDRAEPSAESLEVLADLLLERDVPLGLRLRDPAATFAADWLGQLSPELELASLEADWEHGVVERLLVRARPSLLPGLGAHALTHLVRRVELIPWGTDRLEAAQTWVTALASARLPWLRRLTLHDVPQASVRKLQTWFAKEDALRAAFPRLEKLTLSTETPRALRTASGTLQLTGRALMLAPPRSEGSLDVASSVVSQFQGVWMLRGVSDQLTLNGVVYERGPGATWTIPLKVGDAFALDGQRYRVS
jgi:hypothetical protein